MSTNTPTQPQPAAGTAVLPEPGDQAEPPPTEQPGGFPASDPVDLQATLTALLQQFHDCAASNIGFPAATDLHLDRALGPFLNYMLNNLGDPHIDGAYTHHTKHLERDALTLIADLLAAPADDRWGYLTSGASEGTEHALWLARLRQPDTVVYYSTAAHHCVRHVVNRLAMASVVIRTTSQGEIDYRDLAREISRRRHLPVTVVANIGTAITEAVDDLHQIGAVLARLAIPRDRRWVHADAALSGIPLALLPRDQRPGMDFADGADSIIVSGHKFLGSPIPYGALIVRDSLRPHSQRAATYTGSPDTTLTNSRAGLAALAAWYTLHRHGTKGLQARAEAARDLAAWTCKQLNQRGIPAWRHPWAFTVVFPTPPGHTADTRYPASHDGTSRIICMPGVTRDHIQTLLHALDAAEPATTPIPVASVPGPRRRLGGLLGRQTSPS
jgi:histidine decarboxylase